MSRGLIQAWKSRLSDAKVNQVSNQGNRTKVKNLVIPAWMRESSATDGSPVNTQPLDFGFRRLENRHPWTLDSGFPAGE
jgi:hypothetical protein